MKMKIQNMYIQQDVFGRHLKLYSFPILLRCSGKRISISTYLAMVVLALCLVASGAIAGSGVLNDYNPYNVDIPDNGGTVNSDLALSGAPSEAAITKVKIYYEIRHTYIGDLKVWLTTYYNGAWHDFILKNGEGGSADNIIETRDNLTTWNGASPNQTWYLVAQDMATGDTGYIDFFELWVTYSFNDPPNTPSNEDPSDGDLYGHCRRRTPDCAPAGPRRNRCLCHPHRYRNRGYVESLEAAKVFRT